MNLQWNLWDKNNEGGVIFWSDWYVYMKKTSMKATVWWEQSHSWACDCERALTNDLGKDFFAKQLSLCMTRPIQTVPNPNTILNQMLPSMKTILDHDFLAPVIIVGIYVTANMVILLRNLPQPEESKFLICYWQLEGQTSSHFLPVGMVLEMWAGIYCIWQKVFASKSVLLLSFTPLYQAKAKWHMTGCASDGYNVDPYNVSTHFEQAVSNAVIKYLSDDV